MRRSLTRNRTRRVIHYEATFDIDGYHIAASNARKVGRFVVTTARRAPNGDICPDSVRVHGSVLGGHGVTARIMTRGMTAIGKGTADHDVTRCETCRRHS